MRGAGKLITKLLRGGRKAAPHILTIGGVVAGGVGCVFFVKQARKLDPILNNYNEQIELIKQYEPTEEEGEYTEEMRKKDLGLVKRQRFFEVMKLFVLPISMEVASVTMVLGGHGIITRRAANYCAAATVSMNAYRELSQKIIDKYGEDEYKDLINGTENTGTKLLTNPETGELEEYDVHKPVSKPVNMYRFVFNSDTSGAYNSDVIYNKDFITKMIKRANHIMVSRPTKTFFMVEMLKLLDMYDYLEKQPGLTPEQVKEIKKMSQVVGWTYDLDEPNGDNKISAEITPLFPNEGDTFDPGYILTFNCEGTVLDKIK